MDDCARRAALISDPGASRPLGVSLPRLPVAFVASALVGAFFVADAVLPVAAWRFEDAGFVAAAFFGAALAAAFFGAALAAAFFGAAFFGVAFFGTVAVGSAFFAAAFLDASCPGGTADGAWSLDEASTVSVPGAGITSVSSCEDQRTRSIDPTSAITTPSRSGPFPDERRIR